jgi:GT2 family glycosyltransferase
MAELGRAPRDPTLRYDCLSMADGEQEQATPQVSVLIVSEDNAPALRRCLKALGASRQRESFEILVVDNGSQDESPHLEAEFPDSVFLRLPRRFGLIKALNIGMRTAKGEFFFFLAPEVEVREDTVAGLAERLASEGAAVAVCPLLVDAEGRPQPQFYRLPGPGDLLRLARKEGWDPIEPGDLSAESLPVAFPSLAALMIRSYFLKGLRYIDERYGQSWAEAEIAAQVRRASRKILLAPGLRAVLHPRELPALRRAARVRALYSADWVLGAATFAGKHYGFASGLKVRLGAAAEGVLGALGSLVTLRDVGYRFARAGFLLSGQKLNGTQRFL